MLSIILLGTFISLGSAQCDTVETGYQCDTSISHNWGNYAPYFSVPSTISADTPAGCSISFVNLLSRHGARFPTTSKTTEYEELFEQIHANTTSYSAEYDFIKNYTYDLGANDLTAFGQQEMIHSGIKFYERYKTLTTLYTPFFRSSSDDRVVESAQNFSQGFHQARGSIDPNYPYPILLISEDDGQNNTLYAQLCTNYEDGPDSDIANDAEDTWRDVWISEVKTRVNDNLIDASLSKSQIIYLMDQCPFNTIANVNGTISSFCGLFNEMEWENYNYYRSLSKWYADLQGNPLGPTQGVGFAAELIARMTNNRNYVTDANSYTSINHTLDYFSTTFPLGPDLVHPLYADFSHDDDLGSIFAALGLYNSTANLSNITLETTTQTNGYSAGWTVPFAARAYFEKMVCLSEVEELVRVVINDRVVPLQNCDADSLGRCTLSKFVASQSFVTGGGLWGQCFD
ncbi:phosphoglycerate mutase-like protein [Mollisia scopiformis]|uniref:Phytase A n=1 Tax=Mollisia scopiformis TaxID=149040 RepID=A0A194WV57_MOLSC|nr:phosphoglycerate mutase-like protein [Mollisia scopiformis]KUJ11549.1 phosphoglycerate mutase-like protein [Mollisia scopiformis]